MAKVKTSYVCSNCGYETSKWNGKCPDCGEWNTFEEVELQVSARTGGKAKSVTVKDVSDSILNINSVDASHNEIRYDTGMHELDRVLGGGLVKGSLVLLGGEPGIGKSTMLLQICQTMGDDHTILYVSGEESTRQIKLRANRLGVNNDNLYLLAENDAESICAAITKEKPEIVIIDSIQTMSISGISSAQGSVTQVRECTNLFMRTAKSEEIPIFIVGHVNKDGAIAGPKVMEHIVDCVLYFEGQRNLTYRILRAVKNRFGSTNEIGVFEMADSGLLEVENPSMLMLEGRPVNVSGSCVACIMEGSRPIMAEVQALVSKSSSSQPKRTATGFDYYRMSIILAVLEKRLGYFFGGLDVFINIVGGLKLDDTAADLTVAMALYSSVTDKVVDDKTIAFGEIGLGGELRNITHAEQRIQEAERMGFERCILPYYTVKKLNTAKYNMQIIGARSIKEAFSQIG
ncbi:MULTISPECIES: DNA repair protein RadA [Ruminococcus]|uniref:DNA repair protein RadA n=1 Tax=Ruminococcus albus 8 TaxID=246199 RepID=E9SI40_RUMAL|nr:MULTISPECIES: DNA repair protein RadA [Ruminococcus]EGC01060.1 DNA repair protein RadA [Ruminococcus albus 8]MBQ9542756.1 DNA repair protein RadA [Ruminococcus sp.]MBR0530114.1 DNA repair protein RadA [Ruminococcus sp.]MCC3352582.1 DNA repair protein RadA [Ruminococcus albus 8]